VSEKIFQKCVKRYLVDIGHKILTSGSLSYSVNIDNRKPVKQFPDLVSVCDKIMYITEVKFKCNSNVFLQQAIGQLFLHKFFYDTHVTEDQHIYQLAIPDHSIGTRISRELEEYLKDILQIEVVYIPIEYYSERLERLSKLR